MLLLLDIDGVMVPSNSWKRPDLLKDGFPAFSPKATQALRKIILEANADIVLTTSHKSRFSIQEWCNIFNVRGFKINNLDRLSENVNHLPRKDEVLNWVNMNNVSNNFIIIDDDTSLNDLPLPLKSRLILTSGTIGLTDELADKAISIFKSETKTVLA